MFSCSDTWYFVLHMLVSFNVGSLLLHDSTQIKETMDIDDFDEIVYGSMRIHNRSRQDTWLLYPLTSHPHLHVATLFTEQAQFNIQMAPSRPIQ